MRDFTGLLKIAADVGKDGGREFEFVVHHFGDKPLTDSDRLFLGRKMVEPSMLLSMFQRQKRSRLSEDEFRRWNDRVGGYDDYASEYSKYRRRRLRGSLLSLLAGAAAGGGFGLAMSPDVTGVERGVTGGVGGVVGALLGIGLHRLTAGNADAHARLESEVGRAVDPLEYMYSE